MKKLFDKIKFMNLRRKEELEEIKKEKPKQDWVKKTWVQKENLKCFIIHTTLRASSTSKWYLDSGCSKQMTGDRSLFSHFVEEQEGCNIW